MTAPAGVLEQAPDAILDNPGDLDDLEHVWCDVCDRTADRALCGAQLDGDPAETCLDELCPHLKCIVCEDLARSHACRPAWVRP